MPSTAVVRTRIARTAPARVGGPAVEPYQAVPVLECGDVHRIFAAEDARWQPGGYEDAESRETARRAGLIPLGTEPTGNCPLYSSLGSSTIRKVSPPT